MSVCSDPECCGTQPVIGGGDSIPPQHREEYQAELEDMETRLKALRLEARALARSGNPAVRAEGKRAEAKCNDDLA